MVLVSELAVAGSRCMVLKSLLNCSELMERVETSMVSMNVLKSLGESYLGSIEVSRELRVREGLWQARGLVCRLVACI